MPTCPCCGGNADIQAIINYELRGSTQRRLANVLAERRGQWLRAAQLTELVYGPRKDGGATQNAIAVNFGLIRKRLAPYGIRLEGRCGGASKTNGRRMDW